METKDYPALYQAADAAAMRTQAAFLNCIRGYWVLLIIGAGLGVYGINSKLSACLAAIVFLAAVFISILMASRQYENTWYRARTVAESVKTSTWRFMMGAEPYEDANPIQIVKSTFRNLLQNILSEHKDLAHELGGELSEREQITKHMLNIRALPIEERRNIYQSERIDEQRTWYAKKSKYNRNHATIWFVILVSLQGLAIAFVLLRIAYPQWKYWPTEIFVVAAGSVLTWIQVKRFRELSAAYSLAAHEIGVIRGELEEVKSAEAFSQFVRDAEKSFSREHTQWIARKD